MKNSLQITQAQSPNCDQSIVVPFKHSTIIERFEKKEQSWFATSQVPTDLIIQVQDMTFYVHKENYATLNSRLVRIYLYPFEDRGSKCKEGDRYALISRSEYMSQLNLPPTNSNFGYDLKLDNFPGGSETFEIILKFCYGLPVDLTPSNVASLRCASEFLQMTEEFEEGNLISKTEAFLAFIVLSSWRDSITILKSCESLSPWAENLQIVRRCSDSIATKATIDNSLTGETSNDKEWWLDNVCTLRIDHFVRIVTAMKAKGSKPDIIGACIMKYAKKWLPGMDAEIEGQTGNGHGHGKNELQLSILSGRREEGSVGHNKEHRMMVEVLVNILPPQREAVPCKFLLCMLKMALVYSASPALVSELETRVGMVLEDATVNGLLIPVYKNGNEGKFGSPDDSTMHDVDMVQRIIEYFLMHEQLEQHEEQKCGKLDVGKLLDGYLAEIARDPNLSISKFQALAEALPENARTCHDGLYRAIDTYMKTHPTIMEYDRRRLCKVMDCKKLSLDACMHAAQNDRMPLRTVVQVLFSEQVKMREAIKGKEQTSNEIFFEQESNQSSTKKEIKSIKAELEKVKAKMAELKHDYSELEQDFEKLSKQKTASSWSSGWKKFKKSTLFHGKMDNEDGRRRRMSLS